MLRLLLLLALALPGQAWAHASLLDSEPADGASLDAAPSAVVLRFDEAVTPIALRLVGPNGQAVPLGPIETQGGLLSATLPAGLSGGIYLLSWRVTSADSHPVAGSAAFGVGMAGHAVQPGGTASDTASVWAVLAQVARWLFYMALMTAAGGALFRALVAEVPAPVLRGLAGAALLGAVLAAVQVGLRGALLAGAGSGGLLDAAPWRLGAGTTLASSLLVSGAGLLGCAVALRQDGPRWRMLGAAAGVLAVAGFPLSGHAATAEPRWLTAPSLALHTLAVAFWLGAFWPLLTLLRGPAPNAAAAVRRFSVLAMPAVAVLVVTGLAIAVVQVERPADLIGTGYGLLLLAKLAGVAGLIALAAWNRLRLTPALDAGTFHTAVLLRRSIGTEVALAGLVLAATSGLTLAVPPRALRHTEHDPAGHLHAPAEGIAVATEARGLLALIEVVPGRAGPNRIVVTLDRVAGPAPAPKEVWVELSQEAAGIGPIRRRLALDAEGRYAYQGPELAIPGRWRVRVEVLVTDFDQASLFTEIEIR